MVGILESEINFWTDSRMIIVQLDQIEGVVKELREGRRLRGERKRDDSKQDRGGGVHEPTIG